MIKRIKSIKECITFCCQTVPTTVLLYLADLLSSLFPFFLAVIFQHLIDGFNTGASAAVPYILIVVWCILCIFQTVFGGLRRIWEHKVRWKTAHQMLDNLQSYFSSLSPLKWENTDFQAKVDRFRRLASSPFDAAQSFSGFIGFIILLLSYFVFLWRLSPFAMLIGTLLIVPPSILTHIASSKAYDLRRARMRDEYEVDLVQRIFMNSRGNREVRIFSAGDMLLDRWKTAFKSLLSKDLKFRFVTNAITCASKVASVLLYIAMFSWLIWQRNTFSVGELLGAVSMSVTIVASITRIQSIYYGIIWSLDEWNEWNEEIVSNKEEAVFSDYNFESNPHISVQGLSFSYPSGNHEVLRDISFSIEQGELIALVGPNGAGKSTLLKLLLGAYQPSTGTVSIEGQPPNRERIGMVFQEPLQYPLSLRENVLLTSESSFPSDILDMLKQHLSDSQIDALILSSDVEGGQNISGGQWQWIAIARALAKKPELFLFDEPTAAMNPQAERDIFRAFRNTTKGKTTIVSTHRLGFAMEADRVVILLPNGTIEAIGTHQELIERSPTYKEMYNTQAKWYKEMNIV